MADPPTSQLPVAQRLRVRYAKRGRLRFTSHRDFARALERAIRRARLPVAYSSGFSPHPRISYANAAPTGAASEAEFLELALTAETDPVAVQAALDEALPNGLDVLEVVVASGGALADRLEASRWVVRLPGVDPADAAGAVDVFLSRDAVEVERMTKSGLRRFDCRGAVLELATRGGEADSGACAILEVVVRHGTPAVRPDDILAGLRETAGLAVPGAVLQTRIAQGPLDTVTGSVGDPLAQDRDAS